MKKTLWITLSLFGLMVMLLAMAIAGYLVFELPNEVGTVTVNGRVLDLKGAHGGHWLLASMGILVALVIAMVLVPTIALLAFVLPVTLTAFGLALGALALGVVLSPLILLVWWLWKRTRKAGTIAP